MGQKRKRGTGEEGINNPAKKLNSLILTAKKLETKTCWEWIFVCLFFQHERKS